MKGPGFLKKKFNKPHTSEEVQKAVKRKEEQTGERIHNPEEKIQTYLDRFKEITSRTDPRHQERGVRALKRVLHQIFVMEYKDVPESYFDLQKKIAREAGHGNIELTEERRQELAETVINDQRNSLNTWIDYLAHPDTNYPDYLVYFAFRSCLLYTSPSPRD